MLDCLVRNKGAVVSKSRIEDSLYAFGAEIESNAVEVFVSRLRKKLGHDLIETQRGLAIVWAQGDEETLDCAPSCHPVDHRGQRDLDPVGRHRLCRASL